jgi:Membrane-fusion protein
VPVSVDAAGGQHVDHGHVAYIDNAIDPTTNTLLVRALFANAGDSLWPGQYVTATATLSVQHDATVIPATALQTSQDGPFVFALQSDGTVRTVPVELDRSVGQQVVLARGLSSGDRVVVRGQLRLSNGAHVEVKPAAPASTLEEAGTEPDS